MFRSLNWLVPCTVVFLLACNYAPDADAQAIEATLLGYYGAVIQEDLAAQTAFWTAARQEEAARQAQAWAKRSKEGLKAADFHVEDTPVVGLKIVHYDLRVKDRNLPESKAALLENDGGAWRLRDIR